MHLARAGGLLVLARLRMAECGLVPTVDPQPGDVGVIETPWGEALAIRTTIGWAMKGEQGVAVMPFRLIQAWTV